MSIDYELAKKLKDAGFPMPSLPKIIGDGDVQWHYSIKAQEWYFIPTLPELIEVCGDKISYIEKGTKGGWYAYNENWGKTEEESCDDCGSGDTPEEAVARLWLELNKDNGKSK